MINVSILCTDPRHPMNATLEDFPLPPDVSLTIVRDMRDLAGGDLLLLIACHEYIEQKYIEKFRASAVIHCADVPDGKGWSPHVWEILDGATELTMTLMDVQVELDSGNVWRKLTLEIQRNEIFEEITEKICGAQNELIKFAIENFVYPRPRPKERQHPKTEYGPNAYLLTASWIPVRVLRNNLICLGLRILDGIHAFYLRGRRFVLELKDGEKDDRF